jgi:hypothetical protein
MGMKNLISTTAASLVALGLASTAFASPISVQFFGGSQLDDSDSDFYDAFGSMTPGFIIEDFEDPTSLSGNLEAGGTIAGGGTGEITAGESLGSSVGMFTSFGGTGSGSTCGSLSADNSCTNIGYQMDPPVNGQGNTIPFEGLYSVNSADTEGMSWTADTGSLFNELVFVLRDPGDQGQKTLTIAAAGETYSTTTRLPNEELLLVQVLFGAHQSSATIDITTSINDAFTIDGAAANVVPLPAAGWMLLAGIGGLAAMRRRQKS